MEKKLTDEQRIKLAEVLGWRKNNISKNVSSDGEVFEYYDNTVKDWELACFCDHFNPDSPEGAAWLVKLWLSLDIVYQSQIRNWYYQQYHPNRFSGGRDVQFTTWFFQNPYEACLLILEVVG